jgi:hypothetical protein
MKKLTHNLILVLAALVLTALSAGGANGQASLLSEDMIDDIVVTPAGSDRKYGVTVVRDAFQRDQWYYVPNAPRLVERIINGKRYPEFALVKYQYDDPNTPGQLLEGAILQFSASLALPGDEIEQIRNELKNRTNIAGLNPNTIRISAMAIKSADVALYMPVANPNDPAAFLSAAANGTGIAPTFASQKMVFSIPLTKIGADIYDALTKEGGTGVPIAVTFKYNGTAPPAGIMATWNYDTVFQHYSSNKELAAEAAYYSLVGGSYKRSSSEVLNELESKQLVDIKLITGETFDMAKADQYLQPVLAKINEGIVQAMVPPATVQPAKAAIGNKGGFFGNANYAASFKNESERKHGHGEYSLNVTSVVERQTIASGFIGIQGYDEEIKNQMVVFAQNGFHSSAFLLPQIAFGNSQDIAQVDLTIRVQGGNPEHNLDNKSAIWGATNGWMVNGKPATLIKFGLEGHNLTSEQKRKVVFETTTKISFTGGNRPSFSYTERVNAFNGSIPAVTPADKVDPVEIGSLIEWTRDRGTPPAAGQPAPKLAAIQTEFKSGSRTARAMLQPQLSNGVTSQPTFYWLVGSSVNGVEDPIDATLVFIFTNGSRVPWNLNGSLRMPGRSPQIFLTDGDVPTP